MATSGTFLTSVLVVGVCTTVQVSLLMVTTGSIVDPAAYVCVPTCEEVVDCPSPKSKTNELKAPLIMTL